MYRLIFRHKAHINIFIYYIGICPIRSCVFLNINFKNNAFIDIKIQPYCAINSFVFTS